jgi:hypothetical protein
LGWWRFLYPGFVRLALEEGVQAVRPSGERVGSAASARPTDGWERYRSNSPPSCEERKRVTGEGGRGEKR